jgi:hypothetical protein
MSTRRYKLADCNPRWAESGGKTCGLSFDCPEGHEACRCVVPFTPALDGAPVPGWYPSGAQWQRTGDTFETLTLVPSIATPPGREGGCALHIFIRDGAIEFCGDSR